MEDANLTVWISVLRKTLGECEGAPQYIETVPKKGYRFTPEMRAGATSEEVDSGSPATSPQT